MPSPRLAGRRNQALTRAVLEEYGDTCHLCLLPGATTRDHLVPHAHGGDDSMENQRPAHMICNSKRQDRPLTPELLAEFRESSLTRTDPRWFFEIRRPGHPAPPVHSLPEPQGKK